MIGGPKPLRLVPVRCWNTINWPWTTGSQPLKLPASIGGDLKGVYSVRTLADADLMAANFNPDRRALIIGGGYIGLEAAAVARTRDVEVVLVEMADRILQRWPRPQRRTIFARSILCAALIFAKVSGLAC